MDNFSNTIELIQESYKMQFFTQKLNYDLLKEYYLIESDDSTGKKIAAWIKEKTQKLVKTLRSWLAAIVKFFTETIPNFIKKVIEKVANFIKRKSKKKKVSIPKGTPDSDKNKIASVANNINKVNNTKAALELSDNKQLDKNSNDIIIDNERKVQAQIDLIPHVYDEVKKDLNDALKDGDQIELDGKQEDGKVKCIRIREDVLKSLNGLTDAANSTMVMIDELINGFSQLSESQIKLSNPKQIVDEVRDQYNSQISRIEYARHRTSLLRDRKIISPEEINSKPFEWVSVSEIQVSLNMFLANKNADKLKKAATDKINSLLKVLANINKIWSTTSYAEAGNELTDILNNTCRVFMNYYTDISKEYANYVGYAVNFYKNAVTGGYNGY